MKKFLTIFAVAALALTAAVSCSDKEDEETIIELKGISVSSPSLDLFVGDEATLTVKYTPENATNQPKATWTSSAETVAVVTEGKVTAVGAGEATITATVTDSETYTYATKTAAYTITVTAAAATKTLTLTGEYTDYNTGDYVRKSLEIEYTDDDTWKDIAERYDEVSIRNISLGPEGKIVYFWYDMSQDIDGCQLKSKQSAYNYELVSINDKVSAYSSYYLQ